MNQCIVTVPKYKSKVRNITRMLVKMDECFKYYDCTVAMKESDCPVKEINEYLRTFHDLEDYVVWKSDDEIITYVERKLANSEIVLALEYGDKETQFPLEHKPAILDEYDDVVGSVTPIEEKKVEEASDNNKISPSYSGSKTRQVMCKINEELYNKDSWRELDTKGCCVVSVGNLKSDEEVDLEYIKNNVSHSSVIHKCVNINIIRTDDRTAVVVVLTWKN